MFTDTDSYEDIKSTSLLADVTDDSCRHEYIEMVPVEQTVTVEIGLLMLNWKTCQL